MEHACHQGYKEQWQFLAAAAECEEIGGSKGTARIRPQSAPSVRATETFNVHSQQRQPQADANAECIGLRTPSLSHATDNSNSLLGTWKWRKASGESHQPRWIMSDQKVARRKQAAAVWRAPAVSNFMPTSGRNLWRSARVSSGSQALYIKPRTINRHYLLHPSSTKAPPYPGADYLWTPDSLLATGAPAGDTSNIEF